MAELFNTRCTQGKLIITETMIIVELGKEGSLKQHTLARSALTGIDSKQVVPAIFGKGGGVNLVFRGQGMDRVQADLVNPGIAKEIVKTLQGR
jgi:hypothetical protein